MGKIFRLLIDLDDPVILLLDEILGHPRASVFFDHFVCDVPLTLFVYQSHDAIDAAVPVRVFLIVFDHLVKMIHTIESTLPKHPADHFGEALAS